MEHQETSQVTATIIVVWEDELRALAKASTAFWAYMEQRENKIDDVGRAMLTQLLEGVRAVTYGIEENPDAPMVISAAPSPSKRKSKAVSS